MSKLKEEIQKRRAGVKNNLIIKYIKGSPDIISKIQTFFLNKS